MHKRSIIFGIGIGMLIVSLISLGVYSIQRGGHRREVAELEYLLEASQNAELAYENNLLAPMDEEAAIQLARALGMVFVDEIDVPEEVSQSINSNVIDDNESDNEAIEPILPLQRPDSPVLNQGFVYVHIPQGMRATEIVSLLASAGVVMDAPAFINFLVSNNFDTLVMHGNKPLPINGDFQDIADRIVSGRPAAPTIGSD